MCSRITTSHIAFNYPVKLQAQNELVLILACFMASDAQSYHEIWQKKIWWCFVVLFCLRSIDHKVNNNIKILKKNKKIPPQSAIIAQRLMGSMDLVRGIEEANV